MIMTWALLTRLHLNVIPYAGDIVFTTENVLLLSKS